MIILKIFLLQILFILKLITDGPLLFLYIPRYYSFLYQLYRLERRNVIYVEGNFTFQIKKKY